jgi:uncharacterized protein YrrD
MREERDEVRLHEISGRNAIARAEAAKIGAVSDILFSPTDGRIGFVTLETAGGLGGLLGRVHAVPGDAIMAIGRDAVIVRDRASLIENADQIDRQGLVSAGDVKGFTVVSDAGERVGQVKDFIVSLSRQRIIAYVVGGSRGGPFGLGTSQRGSEDERVIPLQPDVVIGSELITIPSALLREGSRGTTGDERTSGRTDMSEGERWTR